MTEMIHVGEPMLREEFATWLERLAVSVRQGDSAEGFIEYLFPDPDDDVPADGSWRMVRARVRVGNLMGQGGMTMIGKFVERTAPTRPEEAADGDRATDPRD